MQSLKITTVVGARPQFIKAAAVSRAIANSHETLGKIRVEEHVVHTGQHYDANMSQVFFDELQIPAPAVNLEVASGPHGQQTGRMLERLEQVLLEQRPDWVLVYGDTNSTLAAALAAVKLHIPVAHVEAGLRSFNRRMPEEINRIVTDHLSTLLFCPSQTAVDNLAKEGITAGVHRVGDVMYDSILFNVALAEEKSDAVSRLGLEPKQYYLATVHRAENTDESGRISEILRALCQLDWPVVLPLHPRTRKTLGNALAGHHHRLRVIEPVPYLDMLLLEKNARVILTDSGGVQKEAYWLRVPCVTLRDETEWVELVSAGWNRIAGTGADSILSEVARFESQTEDHLHSHRTDIYGEGCAAVEITRILAQIAESSCR